MMGDRNSLTPEVGSQLAGRYPCENPISMQGTSNHSTAVATTASQSVGASPAGTYHWRAPSPPHIHIPPTRDDSQMLLRHTDIFVGNAANEEALKVITDNYYVARPTDWKYEWRRQAQQILSFLYLGPSVAARNIEFIRNEGITMLLCVRDSKSAVGNFLSGEKVAKQLGIEAAHVDVADTQHLTHRLREAVHMINDHLISQYRQRSPTSPDERTWGKVLVFCESGNERSATVAAAYLITMFDVDLIGAVQYIQAQRFCVAYDDGLKHLLLSYGQMIEAEKMTVRARPKVHAQDQNQNSKASVKRSRDDMDEDMDMELDQVDDQARFEGRRVFVPFMDNGLQNRNAMS